MAGYAVTFSVVDNATKQIDGINRRIAALRAPMDRMSKSISRFVDVSGLGKVASGFEAIGRAAGSVLRTLVEIVPVLGTLTGAATIGGMAKLVQSYADWSHELTATADNLGITTQQLQKFQNATRLAGGNAADMTDAMKSLYKVQTDFVRGQASAETIGWLNRLGINVRDASGHLRSMADLMPEVIDKISKIENPADRAAASAALLGDANAKLVETFRQSHRSFSDWFNDAGRYQSLTQAQSDALQRFTEAQGRLGVAFGTLGEQISATLAQNFTPLMNKLSEFVEKNTPAILAAVDELSARFAAWLSDPATWKAFEDGLVAIKDALVWITTHLDEIKIATEAVAAIFVLKWAGDAVGAVVRLTSALGTATEGGSLLGKLALAGTLATAAFGAWQKLHDAETYNPKNFAPDSPFWQGMPKDEQLKYPQSPASREQQQQQGGGGGGPSFMQSPGGWLKNRLGFGGSSAPSGAPGAMNLPGGDAARAASIRDRLASDLNLSPEQASGIVGNLQAESGLKAVQEKNPLGGGRGGFGWAQWTGPRRVAFEKYAAENNLDPKSDEANYGFLRQELSSPQYKGMMDRLRAKQGPDAAGSSAALVEKEFEGPAVSNAAVRARFATQVAATPSPPVATAPPVAVAPPVASGPPVSLASAQTPVNGSVDVNITHKNPPANTAVTATGTGSVNVAPPRVEHQELASI